MTQRPTRRLDISAPDAAFSLTPVLRDVHQHRVRGDMRRVREHRAATRVMSRCTECGAQARQVIRRLRTDTNAAPAVITTALYQELPVATDEAADEVGSGRKL